MRRRSKTTADRPPATIAELPFREGRQLTLFENPETAHQLDQALWYRSFERSRSNIHRLATYEHRLAPAVVQVLIDLYSKPGEVVLDPFSGSGTIAFEVAAADRLAWANDLNPYAYVLTRAKLEMPDSVRLALQQAIALVDQVETLAPTGDLNQHSAWVQAFFHPDTLREIGIACELLKQQENFFLLACLLGILHHTRPGYLSYPTSQTAPYLRQASYPPEQYPELYEYRDVRSRLLTKIRRLYQHATFPQTWEQQRYQLWQMDAATLPLADASVDAIITAPPYPGACGYVRDHRLRLHFLGHSQWQTLHESLIQSQDFRDRMGACLATLARVLKPGGYCVFAFGKPARHIQLSQVISTFAALATETTEQRLQVQTMHENSILVMQRTQ